MNTIFGRWSENPVFTTFWLNVATQEFKFEMETILETRPPSEHGIYLKATLLIFQCLANGACWLFHVNTVQASENMPVVFLSPGTRLHLVGSSVLWKMLTNQRRGLK